jgi:DNA sulfur modification protein DndD
MRINSIRLVNFLSYYGDNELVFDDGPTIIVGQNNTGKSKLFDAFNWVLYDRAYKTEEEDWCETRSWGVDLINHKARHECAVNAAVDAEVSLEFSDDRGSCYILTRSFSVVRDDENRWNARRLESTVALTKTEGGTSNSTSWADRDAEAALQELFPNKLSKYFLFQGENVGKIVSLSERSTFSRALEELSRIQIFRDARDYANKVARRTMKELNDKADKDQRVQNQKQRLTLQKDDLQAQIDALHADLTGLDSEIEAAEAVSQAKEVELAKYQECEKLLADIDSERQRLESLNIKRADTLRLQREVVLSDWAYLGTGSILEQFAQLYEQTKRDKRIPEPIRQDFLKEMLREELCKVCGRRAAKFSPEYEAIQRLINDKSLEPAHALINGLGLKVGEDLPDIQDIPSRITAFLAELNQYDAEIRHSTMLLRKAREDLLSVIPQGMSADSLELGRLKFLRDAYSQTERDLSRLRGKREGCAKVLEGRQNELAKVVAEYNQLVGNSAKSTEQARYVLAEQLARNMEQVFIVFHRGLIKDIQESARDSYSRMLASSESVSGNVVLDVEANEIYTVDEHGARIFNINQANKVSLQVAFVSAVLTVSGRFWNTQFPFVADAPESALGGNNRVTMLCTMWDVFPQSILIVKDSAVTSNQESVRSDALRRLISQDGRVKNAYELKMDGDSVVTQHTIIRRLK